MGDITWADDDNDPVIPKIPGPRKPDGLKAPAPGTPDD